MPPAVASGRPQVSLRGTNQGDIVRLLRALANRTLSRGTLATATPNLTSGAFEFMVDGVIYAVTTGGAIALSPLAGAANNLGAAECAIVRIEVPAGTAASPTMRLTMGGKAALAGVTAANKLDHAESEARIPRRTAGHATIGWLVAVGALTWGTTAITANTNVRVYEGDPDLSAQHLQATII